MVLALISEVGDSRRATDPAVLREGQRLAGAMDAYWNALMPNGRDDDLGGLTSVLQALSYADFGQPTANDITGTHGPEPRPAVR